MRCSLEPDEHAPNADQGLQKLVLDEHVRWQADASLFNCGQDKRGLRRTGDPGSRGLNADEHHPGTPCACIVSGKSQVLALFLCRDIAHNLRSLKDILRPHSRHMWIAFPPSGSARTCPANAKLCSSNVGRLGVCVFHCVVPDV